MATSSYPERRVLWHPRQDNKFVVGGGSQITLYEWTPEFPEIRHVTSQHDLQFMKCFAWSPDPFYDDLIAVGLNIGRVDLIRLEASKFARQSNTLTSGPTVSLPTRGSRACNALAFCTADPNYLAVGLDKVRGESSLVIWDINSAASIFTTSTTALNTATAVQPRPQPLLPRVDSSPRQDSRIVQAHASTEVVPSLSWLSQTNHLILAGISYRWLRLFDLRTPIPSTSSVAAKVHGIATDPFDPHRVASYGDGTVSVWDTRKLSHPLLMFTERDALADGARVRQQSTYSCIEFSATRRGLLATMQKDATYVRFWDTMQHQASPTEDSSEGAISRDSSSVGRTTRKSWANLPWTAGIATHSSSLPRDADVHPSLMVCNTFRTKDFPRPLASFALVPHSQPHPLTSNVMVVSREGDLELYAVHDTPKSATWSPRGDLAIGAGQTFKLIPGYHEMTPPPEPWDAPSLEANPQRSSPRSRSQSLQRLEGSVRGRSSGRTNGSNSPALFGRGDEDGFPALSLSPYPTSIVHPGTSGKPAKTRTYSPMSLRNYPLQYEYSSYAKDRVDPSSRPSRSKGHPPQGKSGARSGQDSTSRIRKQQPLKALAHVVSDDVSVLMRSRVIQGYGLSKPQGNTVITQDESDGLLTETWAWLNHSREILCTPTPRVNGYDFTYEGLLGIWEGFRPLPSPPPEGPPIYDMLGVNDVPGPGDSRNSRSPNGRGAFHTALTELAARRDMQHSDWKPTITTSKLLQRQIALDLCGWSLKQEDLSKAIKRWEDGGQYSRAACWLVFTGQRSKALDVLMRSDDETHHIMSGTLAALIPHGPSSSSMKEHCQRLIVRLQDPYLRAMLTHLTSGDWSEVLDEEILPFRERLAVAFQFLGDKAISSYLRRCIERSSASGDIDCLIVAGLTKPGMDILQGYVDHTGDVQTAAIMASFVCPWKFNDRRVEHWTESYRDLLDGFKLFHHRVSFDVERGTVMQVAMQNGDVPRVDYVPPQIMMRCNYCNKPINPSNSTVQAKGRVNACPNCSRPLPRCSVCLISLSVIPDGQREAHLGQTEHKDTIDDAIVICQTCSHGGHASHILDWFFRADGMRSRGVCPVADCDCRCADEY